MAESGGLFVIDAETGDTTQFSSTFAGGSNSITANASAKNNGDYGFKMLFDGAYDTAYGMKSITPADEIYLRFYIYIPSSLTIAVGYTMRVFGANEPLSNQVRFGIYNAYGTMMWKLQVAYDSVDFADEFALDTWIRVEIRYLKHTTNGGAEAWINGTKYASDLDQDLSTQISSVYIGACQCGSNPDAGDYFYLDDIKADTSYIGAYAAGGGVDTAKKRMSATHLLVPSFPMAILPD